jgi:hypothetical protein
MVSDEDVMDGDADAEMILDDAPSAGSTASSSASLLPVLVQPLLALIHPTPLSFPPIGGLSPHPPTTSAISAIHIGALECLNNIFLSLSTSLHPSVASDKESGRKVWDEVWSALEAVGAQSGPGQERKQEIWEVATGVTWGIGNIWKGTLVPHEEQVKVLVQLCDVGSDPRLRVKCIGTLECLAQHPQSITMNAVCPLAAVEQCLSNSSFVQTISNYLLSILDSVPGPSPAETEPLIQAVSALIDIYSDENMPYDVNFRSARYADILASNVEGFKKAVRAIDRRKESGKELRRRGDEVRENLVAFIQYRTNLGL